jgi:putative transposase
MEWFRNRSEAKVVIETWRRQYNEARPHSSLGQQAPAAFRKYCGIAAEPAATFQ